MSVEVPADFYSKLTAKYEAALKDHHLVFNGESATSEIIERTVNDTTIDYQLTLLHSLQHRPENGKKEDNPFAKPEPELTILDTFGVDEEFRVVFNKFPVVPYHFMVVSKEFKLQDTPLSPTELAATFSLLKHLKKSNKAKNWFAFYNCGPQSGASQPHKHIQFMTLPDNYVPHAELVANKSQPFIPSAKEEPLQDASVPYAHFIGRLPDDLSSLSDDDLTMYFVSLLQRTLTVLRDSGQKHISYNVVITTKYLMLVPRSSAKYEDLLGINSCGVVGLFLCKNEELLNKVKNVGPEKLLEAVGFPNTSGEGTDEYHY